MVAFRLGLSLSLMLMPSLALQLGGSQRPPTEGLTRPLQQTGSAFWQTDQYLWGSPIEQRDLFMFSDEDGWFVGVSGQINRWNGFTNAAYPVAGVTGGLNAIDMVSPSDGWIVGDGGVILHWNGVAWQSVTSPTALTLRDIDMVTATDGWIVGGDWPNAVLLRWNGASWVSVPAPAPSVGILLAVKLRTGTDGWAVGSGGTILRWDGSSWAPVASPVASYLIGVDIVSATDAWIVGNTGSYQNGLALHWNGSVWQSVPLPAGVYELEDISLASATDGWATSWYGGQLVHWDGVAWSATVATASLHAVQMLTTRNAWGIGYLLNHGQPRVWQTVPLGGGTLTSSLDTTTYAFASGSFSDGVVVTHTVNSLITRSPGLLGIGHAFDTRATFVSNGQATGTQQAYTLTVQYADPERGPVLEDTLALYRWSGSQWMLEPTSLLDTGANTVTAHPTTLGRWAVLGSARELVLPALLR